ncbi:MAG: YceI family protein [Acidobacteriota bacterium]
MKVRTGFAVFFAAVAFLALPLLATAAEWSVDTSHSHVGFSVRHFLTQVPGRFNDFEGTIVYDADEPSNSSVDITVDAASIDTANENRDGHLKSEDFFHVEKYPQLSFKSTAVESSGSTLQVTGDFTMHGVTKSITVPVEVLGVMGKKAGFSAEFTVDRKDYDVSWNRALDQGGTILGDEVKVRIDVEADLVVTEAEGDQASR